MRSYALISERYIDSYSNQFLFLSLSWLYFEGSVCNCVLPAGMNAPRAQQQVAVEGTVKKNPGSH